MCRVAAGYRPSEVLSDRVDSAFALAAPELMDWLEILKQVRGLHVSGITAALGPATAESAPRAVATTARSQKSVDDHDLAAKLMSRDGLTTTRTYCIGRIVDRIGSGDAFAAGVLHGIGSGLDDQAILDFGLAAACLKHSIPGDFNLRTVADVHNLLQDAGFTVRR